MSKKRDREKADLARLRAELILQVQSGELTATEAAKALGVSRKTYYKWEKRALAGMVHALSDRESGRPGVTPDPEKEHLRRENRLLTKQRMILEQKLQIHDFVRGLDIPSGTAKKK